MLCHFEQRLVNASSQSPKTDAIVSASGSASSRALCCTRAKQVEPVGGFKAQPELRRRTERPRKEDGRLRLYRFFPLQDLIYRLQGPSDDLRKVAPGPAPGIKLVLEYLARRNGFVWPRFGLHVSPHSVC